MRNDIIRIPEPWDKHLDKLTFSERDCSESFKETGLSGKFVRRPETPTWKKPEAVNEQNVSAKAANGTQNKMN